MEEIGCRVKLELMGTRVDVLISGSGASDLEKAVGAAWDRCLAPGPDTPPASVVEVVLDQDPSVIALARARGVVAGDDELPVMSSLTSALTLAAIASRHGQLLMLHACAMSDPRSGATVVLVAPSGTGKTTAALALGSELGYLTDETAAIGLDDVVIPYPKPLSLLTDGRPPKHQVSPTALGLLEAPDVARVTAVALLHRTSDPVVPSVESVGTLEALAKIAGQSSALQLLPRPLHLLAGLLDRTGGLKRITYHQVMEAVPLITDLLKDGDR